LYSDGYEDQNGGSQNKRFMSQNLRSLYQNISEKSKEEPAIPNVKNIIYF
jgi:hypothetical protein